MLSISSNKIIPDLPNSTGGFKPPSLARKDQYKRLNESDCHHKNQLTDRHLQELRELT